MCACADRTSKMKRGYRAETCVQREGSGAWIGMALASSPAVSGDESKILVPAESRTKTRFAAIKQAVNHLGHARYCEHHSLVVAHSHRPARAQHVQQHKHVQTISWACT
jgi:hypothetical protein